MELRLLTSWPSEREMILDYLSGLSSPDYLEEESRSVWKRWMIIKEEAGEISSMRMTLTRIAGFEDGVTAQWAKEFPDDSRKFENPQLSVSQEIGISVPYLQWPEFFQLPEGVGNDSRPSKVTQPWQHLIWAHWDPSWTSELQNCEIIYLCSFRPRSI